MGSHYSIIDARIVVRLVDYSYELNWRQIIYKMQRSGLFFSSLLLTYPNLTSLPLHLYYLGKVKSITTIFTY